MKAPTLEDASAELEALVTVNPDVETIQINLQRYMGLLSAYISLVKNVQSPRRYSGHFEEEARK